MGGCLSRVKDSPKDQDVAATDSMEKRDSEKSALPTPSTSPAVQVPEVLITPPTRTSTGQVPMFSAIQYQDEPEEPVGRKSAPIRAIATGKAKPSSFDYPEQSNSQGAERHHHGDPSQTTNNPTSESNGNHGYHGGESYGGVDRGHDYGGSHGGDYGGYSGGGDHGGSYGGDYGGDHGW